MASDHDEELESRKPFEDAAMDMVSVLEEFDALWARRKDLAPSDKERLSRLVKLIYQNRKLVLVTPDDKDADIHKQLVSTEKQDKVHPMGGLEELKKYRLGYEGDSKQTYALIVPDGKGSQRVLAVVYTHWSVQPKTDGVVGYDALPGNVHDILTSASRPMDMGKEPNAVTFYSISSFMPQAGWQLVEDLYNKINNETDRNVAIATLSPLRTFKEWLDQEDIDTDSGSLTDEFTKAAALRYLETNQDPVQKFHMSNGAIIGDIKLQANVAGSVDAKDGMGVMVSYLYCRDKQKLERNKERYAKGVISIAEALYEDLNLDDFAVEALFTGRDKQPVVRVSKPRIS